MKDQNMPRWLFFTFFSLVSGFGCPFSLNVRSTSSYSLQIRMQIREEKNQQQLIRIQQMNETH